MTFRERFLSACYCRPADRPPIWMMRQAGRSLPEYRTLKGARKFTELIQNPELAAKATLQPIYRFGYDAAVIFSDILVVAEAMGRKYELLEKDGIKMDCKLNSMADIERLTSANVPEHTGYTAEAIKTVRRELGKERALIGFAGSPWTLASFMVEGGSSRACIRSRAMLYSEPRLFHMLLEKITEATIAFLKVQIEAGADAVQLFDSHGGLLSSHMFWEVSGRWMQRIIDELGGAIPVIVFAHNVHHNWGEVARTGANVLGVDWGLGLRGVAGSLSDNVAVQGNLDPAVLLAQPKNAAAETQRILDQMRGRAGFIFNLGHGVPPEADLAAVEAVVQTVKEFI